MNAVAGDAPDLWALTDYMVGKVRALALDRANAESIYLSPGPTLQGDELASANQVAKNLGAAGDYLREFESIAEWIDDDRRKDVLERIADALFVVDRIRMNKGHSRTNAILSITLSELLKEIREFFDRLRASD